MAKKTVVKKRQASSAGPNLGQFQEKVKEAILGLIYGRENGAVAPRVKSGDSWSLGQGSFTLRELREYLLTQRCKKPLVASRAVEEVVYALKRANLLRYGEKSTGDKAHRYYPEKQLEKERGGLMTDGQLTNEEREAAENELDELRQDVDEAGLESGVTAKLKGLLPMAPLSTKADVESILSVRKELDRLKAQPPEATEPPAKKDGDKKELDADEAIQQHMDELRNHNVIVPKEEHSKLLAANNRLNQLNDAAKKGGLITKDETLVVNSIQGFVSLAVRYSQLQRAFQAIPEDVRGGEKDLTAKSFEAVMREVKKRAVEEVRQEDEELKATLSSDAHAKGYWVRLGAFVLVALITLGCGIWYLQSQSADIKPWTPSENEKKVENTQ